MFEDQRYSLVSPDLVSWIAQTVLAASFNRHRLVRSSFFEFDIPSLPLLPINYNKTWNGWLAKGRKNKDRRRSDAEEFIKYTLFYAVVCMLSGDLTTLFYCDVFLSCHTFLYLPVFD